MKRLEDVKIEELVTFFRDVGRRWTSKTKVSEKKRAVIESHGNFALIKEKNYLPGSYMFGRIESFEKYSFEFRKAGGTGVFDIKYKDVQELIVENR